jgi:hypothetical protein
MSRTLGMFVVVIVLLSALTPARAQVTGADSYGMEYGGYRGSTYDNQPFGGFGFEYGQVARAGGMILDQYGIVRQAPGFAPAPTAPAPRARARQTLAGSSRVAARASFALPTGSLYWPGASGVILYSPATRYQSYGSGYGRSPYGSVDCSTMYKGWPLGY